MDFSHMKTLRRRRHARSPRQDQGRLGQVAPGRRGLMRPPDAQTPERQDLQNGGATCGALRGRMLAGGHQSRKGPARHGDAHVALKSRTHPTRPRATNVGCPTASCTDPGEDARSPPEMVRPRDEAGRRVGRAIGDHAAGLKTLARQTERGHENFEYRTGGRPRSGPVEKGHPTSGPCAYAGTTLGRRRRSNLGENRGNLFAFTESLISRFFVIIHRWYYLTQYCQF